MSGTDKNRGLGILQACLFYIDTMPRIPKVCCKSNELHPILYKYFWKNINLLRIMALFRVELILYGCGGIYETTHN